MGELKAQEELKVCRRDGLWGGEILVMAATDMMIPSRCSRAELGGGG